MKNQEQLTEEEIKKTEQFQIGRNLAEEQEQKNQKGGNTSTASGYTSGETQYADGKGTRLEEETDGPEIDKQEPDRERDEDDADFENQDDDPA